MNVTVERGITTFKTTRIQKIPTYQIILWWAGPEECRLTQRSQVLMQLHVLAKEHTQNQETGGRSYTLTQHSLARYNTLKNSTILHTAFIMNLDHIYWFV